MSLLKIWTVILTWSAAQLASGGSVAGTIRLPGARPAAGVKVMAMVVPGPGRSANELSEAVRITETDSNGCYQLPELEPVRSVLAGGKKTMITGVVTQKLTSTGAEYFRMDVKDALTGAVTPWAIYVAKDWLVPKITVGETLEVPGTLSTDGTNRRSADAS